jgi:hypothetical protein
MNGSPLLVSMNPPSTIWIGCSGGSHGVDVVVTPSTVGDVVVVLVVVSPRAGAVDGAVGSVEPVHAPTMMIVTPAMRNRVVRCIAAQRCQMALPLRDGTHASRCRQEYREQIGHMGVRWTHGEA